MRKSQLLIGIAQFMAACIAVFAQRPVITEFGPDGTLTWTATGTDAVYRIEWASSITNQWMSDWRRLRDIPGRAGETMSVGVPMFFRVVATTGVVISVAEPGTAGEISPKTSSVSPPADGEGQRARSDAGERSRARKRGGQPVQAVRSVTPSGGLIAWYDFDDGAVQDGSGYGNDGIPHGVVPALDRHRVANSAMYFNGTNAWIEVFSSGVYDDLDEITLALWIRPIDDGRGRIEQNLLSKQPSGWLSTSHGPQTSNHGGLFDLNLYMENGGGQVYFCSQVQPNMTSEGHVARMQPLPANEWRHLAVTVSRTQNRIRVYVNGDKADDVVCPDHPGQLLSQPNREPLRIGKRKDADFARRFFCGWMDDVRIYDRVLNDEEVATLVSAP